ncbi:MAG: carbonic anhydrase [Candidatus Babeliales bacterium]
MSYKQFDKNISDKHAWAFRRKLGIPPNLQLFVLACMDERLPIQQALGLQLGDAHIFRNAGGLVTDDALRSAMFSTHFAGTKQIIIINHTDCGMMTKDSNFFVQQLQQKNIDIESVSLNPQVSALTLNDQGKNFESWLQMFDDIEAICQQQIITLRNSPLIPKDVSIEGYIWDVQNESLQKPYSNKKISTCIANKKEK